MAAQHFAHGFHGITHHEVVRRLHHEPIDVAARIRQAVQGGVERCERGLVERLAKEAALMLDDADDLIRNPTDP